MRIQNNIMALNTHRQYNIANSSTASSAEKLSSGYKINRAGDDAAGLAISEKMRAQIRGLNMASKNSLDAVSLIQTAEGALQSTHDILQRMRELAVQSASDGNEQVIDRGALNREFQALKAEIDDTAAKTRFNDQNLIDGTFQAKMYSVDVSTAKLTTGTTASVARVGTKDIQVGSDVRIKAQYIAARDAINAVRAQVENTIATRTAPGGTNDNGIVLKADFLAEVGAKNNGKVYTIRAEGEGQDINNLVVKLDDGISPAITGKIENFSGDMTKGGTLDIHFEGIGTLSILVRSHDPVGSTEPNISNLTKAMNNKELTFSNTTLQITSGLNTINTTALASGAATALENGKVNLTVAETGVTIDKAAGALTKTGAAKTQTVTAAGTLGTAASVEYTYEDVDGSTDAMKAGKLTITLAGVGSVVLDFDEAANMTQVTGEYTPGGLSGRQTQLLNAINSVLGAAGGTIAEFGVVAGGVDAVDAVDASIVLSLNGESTTVRQNDKYAAFDHSGVTLSFNAMNLSTVIDDYTAALKFTSAVTGGNSIKLDVVKTDGRDLVVQSGANQGDEMRINIDAMNLKMLGLTNSSIDTQRSASRAITEVNNAINQVSTQRSALGALQNRLNFKIANLDTSAENLQAAESRIRDVDMAAEMTKFTKSNILVQAATAMLAQANSAPQNVLQLLR